ncbi:MAG: Aminoglycoside 3-N-acetyltransferase [Paenibacillus sp.]|nr:Aminoglycoside 3-N-acetyltransferase [Paenibacillus sp.]
MTMNKDIIRDYLVREGLNDKALCIHSSYRSFGYVEGGPDAVVDALLEAGSTILVPTFTSSMRVAPPVGTKLPPKNGMDYSLNEYEEHHEVYDPDSNLVDIRTMGAIPAAVLRRADRRRGLHPTNSFSAVGPLADALVSKQNAADIWAPLKALVELEGVVVLMGVGYKSMSLFHLAELHIGRGLFVRWVNDGSGNKMEVSAGNCSLGFDRFAEAVNPYVRSIQVGSSKWILCPAREGVQAAAEAMLANPYLTRCDNPGCIRCMDLY